MAALWLAVVGARALGADHEVGTAITRMVGDMVGPAMLVVVLAIVLCERAWPAVPRPLLCRAHLVDACYVVIAALVVVPLLPLVQAGLYFELVTRASFLILGHFPAIPQIAISVAILVGIDAMNWCAHVSNHRILAFWRLHALHHSQEDLSVLTTFRTHPLLHATYVLSVLPVVTLSASGTVPAAAVLAYGCLVTLPHANVRWTFGPLGRVFVSPAYHRLHHARDGGGSGAVNFGFVLVCWDQLARRAQYPDASVLVPTGLAGRPVPVEQDEGRAVPRTLLGQLAQPFRRVAATDVSA